MDNIMAVKTQPRRSSPSHVYPGPLIPTSTICAFNAADPKLVTNLSFRLRETRCQICQLLNPAPTPPSVTCTLSNGYGSDFSDLRIPSCPVLSWSTCVPSPNIRALEAHKSLTPQSLIDCLPVL